MNEEIIVLEEETEIIEEIEIKETDIVVNSRTRHNALVDRNDANSHEIEAIRGLRAELDKIETPRVIESDMRQQADYYKWEDESNIPEVPYGLFVSLHTYITNEETGVRCGTGNIQICNGTMDVFGVTVEGAGFVGNQEYIKLDSGEKIGRDSMYSLVVHSGIVAVQCQSDVVVGDYVEPDAFGKAKKVEYGKYGYIVTGVSEIYGVKCAIISLSAPSMIAQHLSDTLYGETDALYEYTEGLVTRMKKAEGNISNLTTSLQDFKNPDGEELATKEDLDKVYDKVDGIDKVVNEAATNAQNAATQASLAAKDAADIRSEAVSKANESITAIKQIGESVKTLTYDIADYSVGEYSQAYGLTYEQAKKAIEIDNKIGCVHIPTVDHEEMYEGYEAVHKDSSDIPSNIQKFTKRCYYTWDGEQWIPSNVGGVVFSSTEYFTGESTPYWVVEDDVTAEDGNVYHKGEVWYWNDGKPELVTTVDQNGFSRAVNYIRKAINETSIEVTNARGDAATLQAKLNEEGAKTSMIASLVVDQEEGTPKAIYTTKEELEANETEPDKEAYYCVGDKPPYDVYKWFDGDDNVVGGFNKVINKYYDGVYFCKTNTANIIAGVNAADGKSFVGIHADKINFNAGTYTIGADKIDFEAKEDYSVLAERITLNGNQINFSADDYEVISKNIKLDADQVDLNGYVTFTNLQEGTVSGQTIINGGLIDTTNLRVDAANIDGELTVGTIQSPNYDENPKIMIWNEESVEEVSVINEMQSDEISVINEEIPEVEEEVVSTEVEKTNETFSEGLRYITRDNGGEYQVVGIGTCTDTIIRIPETHNDIPVTSIGGDYYTDDSGELQYVGAFSNNKAITSVIIPDSVTYIGTNAFSGCSNLQNVVVGNGVTDIAAGAFYNCTNLTSIIFDENSALKSIGMYKFTSKYDFANKSEATIDDLGVFEDCSKLIGIVIPDSTTSIGTRAFIGCIGLNNIFIPESVANIGEDAFYMCSNLTIYCEAESQPSGWNISWNPTGWTVVWDCKAIGKTDDGFVWMLDKTDHIKIIDYKSIATILEIPKQIDGYQVTYVGNNAFSGCNTLKYVVIPYGVTSIERYAFAYCNNLVSVKIPKGVITVGDYVFYGSNNVIIYCGAEQPADNWDTNWNFTDCPVVWNYNEIEGTTSNGISWVMRTDTNTVSVKSYSGIDEIFIIPETINGSPVTEIRNNAFDGCNFNGVVIPSTMKTIMAGAFINCTNLSRVYYYGTSLYDWQKIEREDCGFNDDMVYYFSATQPPDDGQYWCYDGGFRISRDGLMIDSPHFKVSSSGVINATSATMSGTINASAGKIGGCNISKDGAITSANGHFKVDADGNLEAVNATIYGTIRSDSGNIGGLTIEGSELRANNFKIKNNINEGITETSLNFYDQDENPITTLRTNGLDTYNVNTEKLKSNEIISNSLVCGGITINDASLSGTGGGAFSFNAGTSKDTYKITISRGSGSNFEIHLSKSPSCSIYGSFEYVSNADGEVATGTFYFGAGTSGLYQYYTHGWFFGVSDFGFTEINGTKYSGRPGSVDITINTGGNIGVIGSLLPNSSNSLGRDDKRWNNIYGNNIYNSAGIIGDSDRSIKYDIEQISENYSLLFDELKPVTYKFIDGESGRTHVGLIAQELKDAMDSRGIDSKDFAAYCEWETEDGRKRCGIRYSELIALNIYEIQKLKKQVEALTNELNELKNTTK